MGVSRRKDRSSWQVRRKVTLAGKPSTIRESFRTREEAEQRDREIRDQIAKAKAAEKLGILPVVGAEEAAQPGTLRAWWLGCLEWSRQHSRPKTYATKLAIGRLHLLPQLGDLPLHALSPAVLDSWQTKLLAEGLGASTVSRIRAELHWALARAVQLEVIGRNALERTIAPKIQQADQTWTYLDRAELDAYLVALAEEPEPWASMLLLSVDAGLRVGEQLGLRWSDVDLERGQIVVRNTRTVAGAEGVVEGPPKSGRDRVVGLTDRLRARLRELGSRFRGSYVLLDQGEPVHPDQPRYPHRRTLARAGITRHVRYHDLRHTWASHLAMRGVPLAHLQQLGGWSDYRMVQRYAHLSTESVVDQVKLLERPEKKKGKVRVFRISPGGGHQRPGQGGHQNEEP
jgi:integrase